MIDNKYDLSEFELLGEYTHPLQVPNRTILGREAVMEQIKAALYRPELSNVMLIAPAGSGKGHTPDTMIAVNDSRGYIRFDELKVGDKVFDENGLPTKVIGVYPQGKKDVYEVTFSDGSKVYCNDEHIWNVRNKWSHRKDKSFTNMTLSEIMKEGVISKEFHSVGNRVCKNIKWYIPMNRAIDRKPIKLHVHPYVLGVLLGDGVLSHPDMNNLVISSNDEWIINKVSELIGANGYTDNNRNYSWYFYSDINGQGTRTNSKYVKLRDILKGDAKSLIGKKSPERFIPERYFLGSIYQRKALLQGLMDTDGCVTNGFRANCSYSTNSKRLAEDVLRLAHSLGYRGRISSSNRKNSVHNNAEYEVHFSVANDKKCELFTLPRHLEKLEKCLSERNENMAVRRFDDIGIRSIRKLKKKDDIICIYVEGESHLYQVGYEHIVTHNTAVVQGIMLRDKDRIYLEVDLAKMLSELTDKNQMADILKRLFDEAVRYRNTTGKDLVLFIDEFHQIMALSPAAAEALKPILADSGVRGIKVIAATTIEEFTEWIKPNLPLQERLQRINLPPVDKETTIAILRNMAETYGVENQFYNDFMYEKIYEYTNRYIPASVQPRKSIRIFDAMVGWHRSTGRKLNEELLAEVIYESENVKVDFDIDALHIKEELDKKVFAQDFATKTIEERLQICAAGLNNKGKPMSSFLFSGSTGVGKTETTKQLAVLLFGDDDRRLIRMDMTEYANDDSLERFRKVLTDSVWARPYSIVLFDEVEKACASVTRVLLQVLDDGRLIDSNNREVTFTNAYIVMTTNAGNEIYKTIAQYNVDDEGSGKIMAKYDKLIRRSLSETTGGNRFPPELLGRIDCIVPFQPLSMATQREIVRTKLKELQDRVMRQHGVKMTIQKDVIKYLVEDNLDTQADSGGARIVISKLEKEVISAVSRFLNTYPEIHNIGIKVEGDMMTDNKNQLESTAYIKVVAVNAKDKDKVH